MTNGERYSIPVIMYYSSSPFDKQDFFNEVKQDDELHFVVWEDDEEEYPTIYQLECNDKEYLSYKGAIRAIQKGQVILFIEGIFFSCIAAAFLW